MSASVGPFVLERLLGQGALGRVWSAVHEQTKARVAIKVLGERALDESTAAGPRREVRAQAALDHPRIAQVFDLGTVPDGHATLPSGLPPGLEDWLGTLLEKDPASRCQRAFDAAAVLVAVEGEALDDDWPDTVRSQWTPRLLGTGLGLYGLRRPPLVGRTEEQSILRRRLGERQGSVLLRGGAGVGKRGVGALVLESRTP